MKPFDTKEVRKRIRTLLCHVGALQGSYPQVLEDPEYARAHLLVMRKVLPYMTHVLRFTAEMIPVVEKVIGVAGTGSAQLGDVSRNLRNIDSAAEDAVQQILSGIEQVGDKLRAVQDAAGQGDDVESAIDSANAQLMELFSALQFQDITSQKIEATHALLAQLEEGLNSLVRQLGVPPESAEIEVQEGTYDAAAVYDIDSMDRVQAAVDAVVEAVQEAADTPDSEQATDAGGADGPVSQGDIDALMDGEK